MSSQMALPATSPLLWEICLSLGIDKSAHSTTGSSSGEKDTHRDRQAEVVLARDKEDRVIQRQDQTSLVWAGKKEARVPLVTLVVDEGGVEDQAQNRPV